MKKELRDYNYPQGVAPSAKLPGGIDDKKVNKKKKSKMKPSKSTTDMFGVKIFNPKASAFDKKG